ncbi:MAG: ABC transporter substrate-binding protein [Arachnia sp.]
MITRRHLLLGAAAVPLAACAPATSDRPSSPGSASALTLGLTYIPNVQFAAFYLGLGEGVFASHGIDLRLRHHGAQEVVFGALLAGEEDLVFCSGDEVAVAAAAGTDLRWVATSYQQFPVAIFVAADSGITSIAELAGRSVGVPGHYGSTYLGALAGLHAAGLGEADLDLLDIGYTQVTALTTGKVDAVVGYLNNEAVQFRLAEFDAVALPVDDPVAPTLVGPGLGALQGTDTGTSTALAAAMLESEGLVIADPEAAIDATAEYVPNLNQAEQRETARSVLEATTALWLREGELSVAVDPAAFERMSELFVATGVSAEPVPAQTYIAD